jgi:hypothetical protein
MPKDKEYLTFCNASNLDFQFCTIKNNVYDDKLGKNRYPHLSELLDPTKFIKRDEHGKFIEYTYMTDVKSEGKAGKAINN